MESIVEKKDSKTNSIDRKEFPHLFELNEKPVDTLIALGHNWDRRDSWTRNSNLKPTPSLPTKLTAIASYLLLLTGGAKRVIFSGGTTVIGNPYTEADAMMDYVKSILTNHGNHELSPREQSLIENGIILERNSYDTYTNAQETKKIINNPNENLGLMSIGFHLYVRAARTFEHNDIAVNQQLPSEELLAETLRYINIHLKDFAQSNPMIAEQFIRIRLELRLLLLEYKNEIVIDRIGFEGKKPYFKVHGRGYHLMARLYQELKRDPSGEKMSAKAYAGRVKAETPIANEKVSLKTRISNWIRKNVKRKS